MQDTIFALSSGPLPAGVAVVRISGPSALEIGKNLVAPAQLPAARTAMLRSISRPADGQIIDRAVVLAFPAPASFTGEDVVELHLHGSIAVVAAIQGVLRDLGARMAEAGEFTRRAFGSGRMDLTQAEALSDLIVAETELQREQAMANAGGRLRQKAEHWREELLRLMAEVEADLDFSDEADVFTRTVAPAIAALANEIENALQSAPIGERIRHGLTIAVIGAPNSGKSSLVNALAGRDVAIVTPHAGTTRDVIEVHLDLGGRAATLLDTAGLRETDDPIESEGIARARARAAAADLVLDLGPSETRNVFNKIDESGEAAGERDGKLYISVRTGAGLAALESWLVRWAERQLPSGELPLVSNARQSELLSAALAALRQPSDDALLQAEFLRAAAISLGRLTGHISPEDVLGAIFGRFCIGK